MFPIKDPDEYRFWQLILEKAKGGLAESVERAIQCECCKRWTFEAPLELISVMPDYYLVRCSGCLTYTEWNKDVARIHGITVEPTDQPTE